MLEWLIPSAMAQAAGGGAPQSAPSIWPILFIVGAIWWFLIFNPQRKYEAARRELLAGLHGTIFSVGDEEIVVEVAERVRITLNKENVAKVVTAENT